MITDFYGRPLAAKPAAAAESGFTRVRPSRDHRFSSSLSSAETTTSFSG